MDSLRVDGAKKNIYIESLGTVIDKERGVFKSKQRDVYSFTLEGGYAVAPAGALHSEAWGEDRILDFGDSFMLDRYLRDNTTLFDLVADILPNQREALLSLIHYGLLCKHPLPQGQAPEPGDTGFPGGFGLRRCQ